MATKPSHRGCTRRNSATCLAAWSSPFALTGSAAKAWCELPHRRHVRSKRAAASSPGVQQASNSAKLDIAAAACVALGWSESRRVSRARKPADEYPTCLCQERHMLRACREGEKLRTEAPLPGARAVVDAGEISGVMSTTVRELRDADEEEAERKERLQEAEGEGEDEDSSEDEDFKPDENDIDEEDGDEGEFEEGMECEIAGKGGKAAPGGKRKRAAAPPKKAASKKPTKAKRGGGIALSDDEADGATGASAAPAEAAPPVDPKQAEEEAKKAAADAKKAAADALWAEMNGSSAPKKPATKPAAAGGLDLKSLIAKASGGGGSSGGGKMVTITETMSFAGKDVSVTKQVLATLHARYAPTRGLAHLEGQG